MATKTKTSYTVNVYVHGMDEPIEVADSSTSNAGYQAYMDFKMGNVIKVPGDEADAYIPDTYIRNEVQKLDMYKRISLLQTEEEFSELQDELIDRFGDIPQSVNRLLEIALLRSLAHEVYVTQLIWKGTKAKLLLYPKAKLIPQRIPELVKKYGNRLKFSAEGQPEFGYELLALRGKVNVRPDVKAVLKELKELLQAMKEELTRGDG